MSTPGSIDDIKPFAELSQNATTAVFKAYQASLERFVLLKRLRPAVSSDEELATRFQEEARIAARIQHPNVVAIFGFGSDRDGAYIIAEFVEGLDLRAVIDRSRVPSDLALFILDEAARGLKAAHDKLVLHRDLKPSNILISRAGEVKLSDFGLASVTGDEGNGEIRGTLAYLAPEQILENAFDARSDLFALGATFFEMLTGHRAFPGVGSKEIFDSILNRDPLPYLRATAGVDEDVERLCMRMMARDPSERFQSARDVIDAVEHARERRGTLADAAALSAFLEAPNAFEVERAPADLEPSIRVVPESSESSGSWRVRRMGLLAGAVLVLLAAIAYAGIRMIRPAPHAQSPSISPPSALIDSTRLDTAASVSSNVDSTSRERGEQAGPAQPVSGEVSIPDASSEESKGESDVVASPSPGYARVHVDTTATVFVGRDSTGLVRMVQPYLIELEAGRHDLTIRNAEFPRVVRSIEIRPGDTTDVRVALWSLVGRLRIQVSPWANVFVDGRPMGQTPLREALILLPGRRELRLVNPEMGVDYTTTVAVPRGESVSRNFILSDLQ